MVVESVKGSHQQLDHELACGQPVEFELLLDDYGDILKDFQLGSDTMSLCFIKVTLAAVQCVSENGNKLGEESLDLPTVINLKLL